MVKRYKSYLHGGQKATFSMDDAFYFAEEYLKEGGELVGTKLLGMSKKQADRRNKLLKTVKWLASKEHYTHSPTERYVKIASHFQHNGMLDKPTEKLKRILNPYKYSQRGK